jgi:hypothetical protein
MLEMVKTEAARHAVDPRKVHEFLRGLFIEDVHAQRVFSLATGVVGVMHAAAASIHAIGIGLSAATGRETRHAIKQVDRLLSNRGIKVWDLFEPWVRFVLGDRDEAVVAFDWTDFDADAQSTIALHLVTKHGRATPLLWLTVDKSKLEGRRNEYEDKVLTRLREIVPLETKVTVLADRGFGDQKLYVGLGDIGFDYVIRFRECISVRDGASGETRTAAEWVAPNGHAKLLRDASVTNAKTTVPAVVCTKAKNMKEAWCLASSRSDLKATEIVKLYGRRFTIEENFRDTKNLRFGLGLSATHIGTPERRDRLLLLVAVAQALLTLLGAAAEDEKLDRHTKANTVKRRTHSLYRQGCIWYQLLPTLREEWLTPLMRRFGELVTQHAVFAELFGIL